MNSNSFIKIVDYSMLKAIKGYVGISGYKKAKNGDFVTDNDLVYVGELKSLYLKKNGKNVYQVGYAIYNALQYHKDKDGVWVKSKENFVTCVTPDTFELRSPVYVIG